MVTNHAYENNQHQFFFFFFVMQISHLYFMKFQDGLIRPVLKFSRSMILWTRERILSLDLTHMAYNAVTQTMEIVNLPRADVAARKRKFTKTRLNLHGMKFSLIT